MHFVPLYKVDRVVEERHKGYLNKQCRFFYSMV